MAIGTPLHSRTSQLCASMQWRDWAGYWAASSYETHPIVEYFAIRNSAALIDVSPLFKYLIEGPDAIKLMNRIVTRDLSRLRMGQVAYTPWCNSDGKVLDDGTVSLLQPDRLRVTSAEPNYRWFALNSIGLRVNIADISSTLAALALQGPNSRAILSAACNQDFSFLKYFAVTESCAAGIPISVSRTGYTGDLGYEIWIAAEHAERMWDHLIEVGKGFGILPAGIYALDMARIEAGYIMQDVDYIGADRALIPDQLYSPYEIGLGWTVHLDKSQPFVGQAALRVEKERSPQRKLVGLQTDWDHLASLYAEEDLPPRLSPLAWRSPVAIYDKKFQVGVATSGTWSPLLKNDLCLGFIRSQFAIPGRTVYVDRMVAQKMKKIRATVVKLPFFDPERKRN